MTGRKHAIRALRVVPIVLLTAAAPERRYTIDGQSSEVEAKVAFLGLASKSAHFRKVSGAITLSADRPEQIDLTVMIDARALTAPDKLTSARLKGSKFFDVERHPVILFVGRTMMMTGDRNAQIAGQITARGVTRPARLTVRFTEPPLRTERGTPLSLYGETVIDRRAFGMTAFPLVVGRNVRIRIRAALSPA